MDLFYTWEKRFLSNKNRNTLILYSIYRIYMLIRILLNLRINNKILLWFVNYLIDRRIKCFKMNDLVNYVNKNVKYSEWQEAILFLL